MSYRSSALVIFIHALIGWALCFATIGVGMALLALQAALIVHAVAAPIFFVGLSMVYFRHFGYTTPLQTAFAFTAIVMLLDLVVAALIILRSLDMFGSPLGTWIPFALIFASTWLTGAFVRTKPRAVARSAQPA